ncbi:ParB/RepB/Spo0J family partition protein [Pseudomonas aeruginosa]
MSTGISDLFSFVKFHKSEDPGLTGETKLLWLSPDLIEEEEGFNLRDYNRPDTIEHIEKLAGAWARGDQLPPLEVKIKDERCFVRDGHCRLRAAKLAISRGSPIKRISVIELKGNDDVANVRLLTSNNSLKLTPIQRANGLQRLRLYGWSNEEIARDIGMTTTAVREAIKLITLPDELQELIEEGVVASYFALKMFRVHGKNSIQMLQEAAEKMRQELAEAANPDGGDGQQPASDSNQAPEATKDKPSAVRISKRHLAPAAKRYSRQFLQTMSTQVTELKTALASSAKPDAKSGEVAFKMPIDLYERFMEFAKQLDEKPAPVEPEASNGQEELDIAS